MIGTVINTFKMLLIKTSHYEKARILIIILHN